MLILTFFSEYLIVHPLDKIKTSYDPIFVDPSSHITSRCYDMPVVRLE